MKNFKVLTLNLAQITLSLPSVLAISLGVSLLSALPGVADGHGDHPDSAQQAALEEAKTNAIQSEFGSINEDASFVGALLDIGWPDEIDASCFVNSFEPEPDLIEGAASVLLFTRNFDLFVDEDLEGLFSRNSALTQQNDYCGAAFYELSEDGATVLFVSLVGVGSGNSSAAVVLWDTDPR